MAELSIIDIIKYSFESIANSRTLILLGLELVILAVYFIFSKLINKKVVKIVSIISSIMVVVFYLTNYISTVTVFINNVSTKLMEFIYFPTTLELVIVLLLSYVIMIVSLVRKSTPKLLKIINFVIPIIISLIFLNVIETINTYDIAFDEFSIFTNKTLMSLTELSVGLFVSWIVGLLLYKLDMIVINRVNLKHENIVEVPELVTVNIEPIEEKALINDDDDEEEEIEMPKLKNALS